MIVVQHISTTVYFRGSIDFLIHDYSLVLGCFLYFSFIAKQTTSPALSCHSVHTRRADLRSLCLRTGPAGCRCGCR